MNPRSFSEFWAALAGATKLAGRCVGFEATTGGNSEETGLDKRVIEVSVGKSSNFCKFIEQSTRKDDDSCGLFGSHTQFMILHVNSFVLQMLLHFCDLVVYAYTFTFPMKIGTSP